LYPTGGRLYGLYLSWSCQEHVSHVNLMSEANKFVSLAGGVTTTYQSVVQVTIVSALVSLNICDWERFTPTGGRLYGLYLSWSCQEHVSHVNLMSDAYSKRSEPFVLRKLGGTGPMIWQRISTSVGVLTLLFILKSHNRMAIYSVLHSV